MTYDKDIWVKGKREELRNLLWWLSTHGPKAPPSLRRSTRRTIRQIAVQVACSGPVLV